MLENYLLWITKHEEITSSKDDDDDEEEEGKQQEEDIVGEIDLAEICDQCNRNCGELYCVDCDILYCKECDRSVHQFKVLQNHLPRIEANAKPKLASDICSVHKDEKLKFFCVTCDAPVCRDCKDSIIGKHHNHNLTSLESAVERANLEFREQIDSAVQLLNSGYKEAELNLVNARVSVQKVLMEMKRKRDVINSIHSDFHVKRLKYVEFQKELEQAFEQLVKLKIHPIKYFFATEEIKSGISKQFKEFEKIAISFDYHFSPFNFKTILSSLEFTSPKRKLPEIRFTKNSNFDASLILTSQGLRDQIVQWIDDPSFECSLLWRGSRDGFSSSVFHTQCDNKGATITIIKSSEGYIFGGYISVSWNSSGNYIADNQAWIFSLTNPSNNPGKFVSRNSNSYQVICNSPFGPTFGTNVFGGQYDIFISSDCNSNSNSYACPKSKAFDIQSFNMKGYGSFCNSLNCTVSEIEIYQIK
jgi:hypothetical protein